MGSRGCKPIAVNEKAPQVDDLEGASGAGGIDLRSPSAILGRLAETKQPASAEISSDRSARTHTPSRAPVFETERRCTAKYL